MTSRETKAAMSRYRQMRLTVTQNITGRCDYSVYAKALSQPWDEHQLLVRASVPVDRQLESTEDVITCLIAVLEDLLLPG